MTSKKENQLKKEVNNIRPGDTVKVHQKIKERGKERIQIFEGIVLARKHGKGISATITVRKIISGVGVEKVFPIHSPAIEKIEIIKRGKVRRSKLYYLRKAKGKKTKLKRKDFEIIKPEKKPAPSETKSEEKPALTEEATEEKPAPLEKEGDKKIIEVPENKKEK